MESKGGTAASPGTPGQSEPASASTGHPLGAMLAAAAGLLLALAGTFAAPEGRAAEAVTRLVTVGLPNWLVVVTIASVVLAGGIVITLALPRIRRRRKKDEEDYEPYQEPRRLPPLLGIALMVLALSPVAALVGMLFWFGQNGGAYGSGQAAIVAQHGGLMPPTAAAPVPGPRLGPASAITTGLLDAVAVLAAFATLAFAAWLAFGDRWLRREPLEDRYRAVVAQAVDAGLDDLEAELDTRVAIQKIYRNFERLLAAASLPRRPWQTPAEFTRSALAKLPLPTAVVQELTRLFEIARFSAHPLGADERGLAWRSLTSIRSTLDAARGRPDGDAP
jgi:hypothetical protein